MSPQRSARQTWKFWRGSFSFLLVTLLLSFLIAPLLMQHAVGRIGNVVLQVSVLVSGIYAVSRSKRDFIAAVIVAVLAVVAIVIALLSANPIGIVAGHATVVFFYVVTIRTILAYIFATERITTDILSGALCVFLLLGFIWATLFSALEFTRPGSLRFSPAESITGAEGDPRLFPYPGFSVFVYYSFVTLATVGYGDIVPASPLARHLSILEAITGQLYLAVLIGRLVGMHVSHSRRAGE